MNETCKLCEILKGMQGFSLLKEEKRYKIYEMPNQELILVFSEHEAMPSWYDVQNYVQDLLRQKGFDVSDWFTDYRKEFGQNHFHLFLRKSNV